jgi:predicted nucleotidyltransferase
MLKLNKTVLINLLNANISGLRLVYLFGSYAAGNQDKKSDLDIAVLADASIDNVSRWELAQTLACELDIDVDLIDLRFASTVLSQQVIEQGIRLFGTEDEDDKFAMKTMSMYQDLQIERAQILDDFSTKP